MTLLSAVLAGALLVAMAYAAARLSARRLARWARLAADYGATDIVDARAESAADFASLCDRYDAWRQVVADTAVRYCLEEDALRLQYVAAPHTVDRPCLSSDEHRDLVDAAAERVRRLRDLAARLERGHVHLGRAWVPRLA